MNLLKKIVVASSLTFLLGSSAVGLSNSNKVEAAQANYKYSDWEYHSTLKNNVKAEKLTVGAIGIVISAYIPWTKGKIATNLGNLYYQLNKQNVYYTQKTYKKYAETGQYLRPVAGEKKVVKFYSDSKRTKYVKTETHYKYTDWYK
ncbi:hypothetical protein ABE28_013210 [Peribacillus muralis]|uniref:Uncharacterized protein n=1 Tax=Peribacillus muralis TaxID=264697 RepID=A0A1B3XQ23_9BACI|nr:hypothetical protein [Peribacillus muralis]AOH55312.1 hypothetical protein ABE28_013210 [Peribacillus muralis]